MCCGAGDPLTNGVAIRGMTFKGGGVATMDDAQLVGVKKGGNGWIVVTIPLTPSSGEGEVLKDGLVSPSPVLTCFVSVALFATLTSLRSSQC